MTSNSSKYKAIELRTKHKWGLGKIAKELGKAKSTISLWLRNYPLDPNMVKMRMSESALRQQGKKRIDRGQKSKHYDVVKYGLTNSHKSHIAESAVLFRLALRGFKVYSSPFDGDKIDWIVETKTRNILKLQVKWARNAKRGMPLLNVRNYSGRYERKRYENKDCDFLIGYDLFSDVAYIYSFKDIENKKNFISCSMEAAENWEKLDEILV